MPDATDQTAGVDDLSRLVREGIEKLRSRLLDLSLANRLLNYKHSDKSRTQIRIVDEVPEILFDKLDQGRKLSFAWIDDPDSEFPDEQTPQFRNALTHARENDVVYLEQKQKLGRRPSSRQLDRIERSLRDRIRRELGLPPKTEKSLPERAKDLGINPSYELPERAESHPRKHLDAKIQTLHYREQMETKLTAIRDGDRTLLQDAGINALYCAFGFVEWYETSTSDTAIYAPLLFFPVEIERNLQNGRYSYVLESRDGDVETNITFSELIKRNFGLDLPQWDMEEDLAKYFMKVRKVISAERKWKLKRWVTVGLFTFSKLVMYRDLDGKYWTNENAFDRHPQLGDLLVGNESCTDVATAPEHPIDSPSQGKATMLVTDADSSQHSAVIDVLSGKNLVIQGPPGTGKSQTITNIIAAALHEGKSILFVAEKMAALEVVKSRLDHLDLGQFCLELHSNKTRKSKIFESLKHRIELPRPALNISQLNQARAACEEIKIELLHYVNQMIEPVGDTGLTVHEVLRGNCVRSSIVENLPKELRLARIDGTKQLDPFSRQQIKGLASDLEMKTAAINNWGGVNTHPWHGLQNDSLNLFHFDRLHATLNDWAQSLVTLEQAMNDAGSETNWPMTSSVRGAREFVNAVGSISAYPPHLSVDIFQQLEKSTDCIELEKCVVHVECLAAAYAELDKRTSRRDSILQTGSAYIREILDEIIELGLAPVRVVDIEGVSIDKQASVKTLEQAFSASTLLAGLLGISEASTQDLSVMVSAVRLLRDLPKATFKYRHQDVMQEDSLPILEEALRQKEKLDLEGSRLSHEIELTLVPTLPEVKAAARALKGTGKIKSLFVRECREAKKLFRTISTRTKGASQEDAANCLIDLASHLQDCENLRSDSELRQAAGPFLKEGEMPLRDLVTVAKWAQNVRKILQSENKRTLAVQEFLFTATREALSEALALADTADYLQLEKSLLVEEISSLTYLKDIVDSNRQQLIKLLELVRRLKTLGISSETSVDELLGFHASVVEAEDRLLKLKKPEVARFLVGNSTWTEQTISLRTTVEFAKSLVEIGLPEPAWLKLIERNVLEGILLLKKHADIISERTALLLAVEELSTSLGQFDKYLWIGFEDFADASLERLRSRSLFASSNMNALPLFLDFLRVEKQARVSPLASILSSMRDAGVEYTNLENAFECVFYRSAAEVLLLEDKKLNSHSGMTHEQLRTRFQQLDRKILVLQRLEIARKLMERRVDPGNARGRSSEKTGLALLLHQIGLQRQMPLRGLFKKAGEAIQTLKPCFLMSPMSVAQFLEPGGLHFDLIVMDEASQVRPEEAIGSIARGSQIVVVGDPMQLPPTTFFQKVDSDDVEDDEDSDSSNAIGHESILDLARSVYQPVRQLRWHYRSQHERLIAFSNSEFYFDSLIVFPSPHGKDPNYGVHSVEVSGVYESGLNHIEAEAVVKAAKEFIHQHPKRSLGIVAMNQQQRELINGMMDNEVFAHDPEAAAYRDRWEDTLERFFVKNLENVQGDERDVIFISTVYGRDPEGNFHQRFGPINGVYGHRRLNVLFTRAKQELKVFTSMDASVEWGPLEDMRPGVRALRNYLQFARDGHLTFPKTTGRSPDSEFESWVIRLLCENGYQVLPQLGVAGYFIDIAVYHPDRPGSFILGIECDGATYHSARSVRDRDRLRQEILERLKWNIYRIWSTDWFRNPSAEFQKLTQAIDRLRARNVS